VNSTNGQKTDRECSGSDRVWIFTSNKKVMLSLVSACLSVSSTIQNPVFQSVGNFTQSSDIIQRPIGSMLSDLETRSEVQNLFANNSVQYCRIE